MRVILAQNMTLPCGVVYCGIPAADVVLSRELPRAPSVAVRQFADVIYFIFEVLFFLFCFVLLPHNFPHTVNARSFTCSHGSDEKNVEGWVNPSIALMQFTLFGGKKKSAILWLKGCYYLLFWGSPATPNTILTTSDKMTPFSCPSLLSQPF